MTTEEDVHELFEGIKRLVREELSSLPDPLRRVLLMVLLDSLSGFKFPQEPGGRKRFVRLIDTYSGSPYMDYVSVGQLQAELSQIAGLSDLKSVIKDKMTKWPDESRICEPLEVDLRLEDLRPLDPSGSAEKQIERARYASLLWKKRNLEIHDALRVVDRWDDLREKVTPYHQPRQEGKKDWELCFPTGFIAELLVDCAHNLAKEANAAGEQ